MVFSSLGPNEKHAFFDLLDEYFQSRPELLSSLSNSNAPSNNQEASQNVDVSSKAAASAVRSALASNPEATANLISTGLRRGAQTSSSVKNSPFATAAANPAIANSIGRVAAASLAFQANQQQQGSSTLPQRTPSPLITGEDATSETTQTSRPPTRTIGGIDTSQWSRNLSSSTTSSSFAKRQDFAPPPTRRVPDFPPAPPKRAATLEPEPEEGEWAEALYDYDSGEAGDLAIKTGDRIKIVSRDSGDWWTGEINNRSGLFPASYVKVL